MGERSHFILGGSLDCCNNVQIYRGKKRKPQILEHCGGAPRIHIYIYIHIHVSIYVHMHIGVIHPSFRPSSSSIIRSFLPEGLGGEGHVLCAGAARKALLLHAGMHLYIHIHTCTLVLHITHC